MTAERITEAKDRAAWLEARRSGLGGSDIAAVVGVSPFRTPVQVYLDKVGEAEPSEAGQAAYWGKQIEDIVAQEFSKRIGVKVRRVNSILRTGEDGWMIANIDRAVVNPEIAGGVRILPDAKQKETGRMLSTDTILECKTASVYVSDLWGDSQEEEIKAGKVTSEHEIPIYYETQVQWYMAVTGAKVCYVAVLIGGQDFRIYEVKRDDATIKALTEACRKFWTGKVLAHIPPAESDFEDVKRLFKRETGPMIEASNETAVAIGEYRTLAEKIKSLKAQQEACATQIAAACGEAEGLTIGGEKAATFKTVKTRRLDSARLKKDDPELYGSYVIESESRRLRVY